MMIIKESRTQLELEVNLTKGKEITLLEIKRFREKSAL